MTKQARCKYLLSEDDYEGCLKSWRDQDPRWLEGKQAELRDEDLDEDQS